MLKFLKMDVFHRQSRERFKRILEDDVDDHEVSMAYSLLEDLIDVQPLPPKRGGSVPGRLAYRKRGRLVHHDIIMRDYFCDNPVYDDVQFRTRFRMSRRLFLKVVEAICAFDSYFVQKPDATGTLGLSSIQKCIAAIRMIGYGVPSDATDEYTRAAKSTAMESMKRFVRAIRGVFEKQYLRQSTREDLEKQISINKARGWPGLFGSIDCMHYQWKNYLVAWCEAKPTILKCP
jgi:hypothetical protein